MSKETSTYEWNPPMSRTEAFENLVGNGFNADKAFTILALIVADTSEGVVDAKYMAEIRELARAYVAHTEMEAEFVRLGSPASAIPST